MYKSSNNVELAVLLTYINRQEYQFNYCAFNRH